VYAGVFSAMTKLDAVNDILSVIGEPPVDELPSGIPDADLAEDFLDRIERNTQARGWWFNREDEVALEPDVDGHVLVPSDVLKWEPYEPGTRYYVRAGRLYDPDTKTDVFTEAVKVNVIYRISWDDLPIVFQAYVVAAASRKFQDRVLGSQKNHQFERPDEQAALIQLNEEETLQTKANSMRDNYSVGEIANRHVNPSLYHW